MPTRQVKIDLVTVRADGSFVMVLVEQGPWEPDQIETNLRRVQDRLYDCVDTIVDGHLFNRYPEAAGQPILIRLDCYGTPDEPVRVLLGRFEAHVREGPDYRDGAVPIEQIQFEYNWRTLAAAQQPKSL